MPCSSVSIINFEHVIAFWVSFSADDDFYERYITAFMTVFFSYDVRLAKLSK